MRCWLFLRRSESRLFFLIFQKCTSQFDRFVHFFYHQSYSHQCKKIPKRTLFHCKTSPKYNRLVCGIVFLIINVLLNYITHYKIHTALKLHFCLYIGITKSAQLLNLLPYNQFFCLFEILVLGKKYSKVMCLADCCFIEIMYRQVNDLSQI